MSVAGQVAMSAAIGGTTEALGGGKFANGAVTGAYVMMFNHMNMLGKEGGPPNLEEGIPQPPNEVVDALYLELNLTDPSLQMGTPSEYIFGFGDAITLASEIFPNRFTPIIGHGLSIYETGTLFFNGQYLEGVWTGVQAAGGLYTIGAKGLFALYQTQYSQMRMGEYYYREFRFNIHQYQITGRDFYMQRAIKYEGFMQRTYQNLQFK